MASETSETSETLAEIVAEIREWANNHAAMGPSALRDIDIANRIEAAAKRAYNAVDSSVCGIEDISNYDIDGVRMAMDKTIGDYYE